MNRHSSIFPLLALVFSIQCLNASGKPQADKRGTRESKEAPQSLSDQKIQKATKRAHHLAEKGAHQEFLNSPKGIAFKKQIETIDQEINSVYEKHLNVSREGPAKEKKLREERDRQLQDLMQRRKKLETEYEILKQASPEYHAMLEKSLKSELGQVKGKSKSLPQEEQEGDQEESDNIP